MRTVLKFDRLTENASTQVLADLLRALGISARVPAEGSSDLKARADKRTADGKPPDLARIVVYEDDADKVTSIAAALGLKLTQGKPKVAEAALRFVADFENGDEGRPPTPEEKKVLRDGDADYCNEDAGNAWCCSRLRGHKGDHIAWDTERVGARWEHTKKAKKKKPAPVSKALKAILAKKPKKSAA